jgi:hypothetical protein
MKFILTESDHFDLNNGSLKVTTPTSFMPPSIFLNKTYDPAYHFIGDMK